MLGQSWDVHISYKHFAFLPLTSSLSYFAVFTIFCSVCADHGQHRIGPPPVTTWPTVHCPLSTVHRPQQPSSSSVCRVLGWCPHDCCPHRRSGKYCNIVYGSTGNTVHFSASWRRPHCREEGVHTCCGSCSH